MAQIMHYNCIYYGIVRECSTFVANVRYHSGKTTYFTIALYAGILYRTSINMQTEVGKAIKTTDFITAVVYAAVVKCL